MNKQLLNVNPRKKHWLDIVATIDDSQKEAQIGHCMRVVTDESKPKSVRAAAFMCMRILIDSRSVGQVRRMEKERGLV